MWSSEIDEAELLRKFEIGTLCIKHVLVNIILVSALQVFH